MWRDGEIYNLQVKLKDRPLPESARGRSSGEDVRPVMTSQTPLGLSVRDLDADTAKRLSIPDLIQGVLISDVDPAGPARLAQLRPNHVILEINRRRVSTVAEYRAVVAGLRPTDAVALLIYERGSGQRVICTILPDAGS